MLALGYLVALLQYGFVPGSDRAFPLAGVRVPVWHLIWMGAWTGYIMALVGEAAGILALPYSMTVLQFSNPYVTPTTQVLALLNPAGALLGFRRTGQYSALFAFPVCAGGLVGGLLGPLLRSTVLSAQGAFQTVLGIALTLVAARIGVDALIRRHAPNPLQGNGRQSASRGQPEPATLTLGCTLKSRRIIVTYGSSSWSLGVAALVVIGALVGLVASALGVGGGFLLVPILVSAYGLPIYVLVAATVPYVVLLSAVSVLTYVFILPVLGFPSLQPEWSWSFFAGAGGIFGAWVGSKTQLFVPERWLSWLLAGITGLAGIAYVVTAYGLVPLGA